MGSSLESVVSATIYFPCKAKHKEKLYERSKEKFPEWALIALPMCKLPRGGGFEMEVIALPDSVF